VKNVLLLAACQLLGKMILAPTGYMVWYFSQSWWGTMAFLVVGTVAINQELHRTWIFVDVDKYLKHPQIWIAQACLFHLTFVLLISELPKMFPLQ
jgi:hypothetical protein